LAKRLGLGLGIDGLGLGNGLRQLGLVHIPAPVQLSVSINSYIMHVLWNYCMSADVSQLTLTE